MDAGNEHGPFGSVTDDRTSQAIGDRGAATEEQEGQQQDITVLDDSD